MLSQTPHRLLPEPGQILPSSITTTSAKCPASEHHEDSSQLLILDKDLDSSSEVPYMDNIWTPTCDFLFEGLPEINNEFTNSITVDELKRLVTTLSERLEEMNLKLKHVSTVLAEVVQWAVALNPVMGRILAVSLNEADLEASDVESFVEQGENLNRIEQS